MIKEHECFLIVYHGDSSVEYSHLPCYPDDISDSQTASWSEQPILGRSSPLTAYNGTGFRNISVNFDMHREMMSEGQVDNILLLFRKAVYPQYQSKGLLPPTIYLCFGSFAMKGILSSYSYTWKKPIIDNKYQVCSVSLSLIDVPDRVFGSSNLQAIPTNPFGAIASGIKY